MNDINVLEEWRPVVGWESDYAVSSYGRLYSWDRRIVDGRTWKGRMLSCTPTKDGYGSVVLCRGKRATRLVHRLVLEAFVGPRRPGYEACHNDGIPGNNNLANLRWGTMKDNRDDRDRHGRTPLGEKHWNVKLKEGDVIEIRKRHAEGESRTSLATRYGLHYMTVVDIVRVRSWKHIA